jgi:hypothetical protein
MHQVGATPFQEPGEHLIFAAVKDRRLLFDELKPAMAQRVGVRLRDQLDIVEREQLAVLERLGHHESVVLVEGADLPVDMQHLRLQKGRAVTGYNSFGHGEARLSVRLRKLSICYSRAETSSDLGSASAPDAVAAAKSQRLR